MLEIKATTVRLLPTQYDSKRVVYIHDNGKKVFGGVIGAIPKMLKAPTLDRNCEVFENDDRLNVYLQRKAV